MLKEYSWFTGEKLANFIDRFDMRRVLGSLEVETTSRDIPTDWLFNVYESRSSARVADVSSVLLRDATIWLMFEEIFRTEIPSVSDYVQPILESFDLSSTHGGALEDDVVARALLESGWGDFV
ncbi:hypothetical protein D3C84_889120 [compost metagenome]